MKKFSGWDVKLYLDDIFFELINKIYQVRFLMQNGKKKYGLKSNKELKGKHDNKRCFVIGNGPSVNKQNLKLLKEEVSFFVNRAFLHPDYEFIQPTYHIIIDAKLQTGEWPISYLDEILDKNPNVTLLLNAKWFNEEKFQPYKIKSKIYWLNFELILTRFFSDEVDLTTISASGAVVESAIICAIYMGFKEISFLGVDGNGLCHNLIGTDSHSYGSNPEDLTKDMLTISKDLYFMSMSLRKWVYLSSYCKDRGINLRNLTEGGIINVCPRADYKNVILG